MSDFGPIIAQLKEQKALKKTNKDSLKTTSHTAKKCQSSAAPHPQTKQSHASKSKVVDALNQTIELNDFEGLDVESASTPRR